MNFTLLVHSLVQRVVHGLKLGLSVFSPACTATVPHLTSQPMPYVTPHLRRDVTQPSNAERALQRPLRILTVHEVGQPQFSVGRMVISGRMADVCAELERLAARESAAL